MRVTLAQLSPLRIFRMFSSSPDAPRRRRPTDVLLLLLSLLLVSVPAVASPGPLPADVALQSLISELDGVLGWFWRLCYAGLLVWTLVLVLGPIVRWRHGRLRLLLDYVLGAATALGLAVLLSLIGGGGVAPAVDSLTSAEPPPVFPAVRLALCAAVIVTASPSITRPYRLVGRAVIVLGAVSAVALELAYASGVVAALAVALAAGSTVHLLLGSPGGRLTPDQVMAALADLGVETDTVSVAPRQVAGEQLVVAHRARGTAVLVKVFGRDAWDAQLIGSTWTALTRRGEAPRLTMGRRERVGHEAMAALLAERAGVPVLPVVAAGEDSGSDALLVVEAPAARLAETVSAPGGETQLADAWDALGRLHDAGIAHRRVDLDRLVVRHDGVVAFSDFADARLHPAETDRMIDRVHLLVATWLVVGTDRALAAALDALGADGVAETLPYLQLPVLTHALRRGITDADLDLTELRDRAVASTGAEDADLVELRRVTSAGLVKGAVVLLLVYMLISLFVGIDIAEVVTQLRDADFVLLLLALAVSPLVQVGLAFATKGAVPSSLPYLPVLMLQYGIQFIAVVLPATAARVAVEIRFFERFGIRPGAAVTMGMIDGVSGFVVQVLLLLLIWFSGLPGVTTTPDAASTDTSTSTSSPSLLGLAVLLALIGILATAVVPSRRRRAMKAVSKARDSLSEQAGLARSAVGVLRRPKNVAQMLGGNLWGQLVQAVVLGICLAAFGESASLSQLILVNTAVSLFAGLMPIPGGVGVAEAGLTYGLQAIGVPSAVALSTAIGYRLVTFYLPPLWGSLAMRWLRKRAYL